MKYLLIVLMIMAVAILGCKAAPQNQENLPLADNTASAEESSEEYEPGIWIDNWEFALETANKLKRPILINFTGSDWCPWCFRLRDEVFVQKEFIDYAKENLVLVVLDFPRAIKQSEELRAQNLSLQKKYDIQGYPTILLVDADAKEIARTGYQQGGAQGYVLHLKELLAQ
ncbi:MAG: thioredoxin family protein [Candidatus Cloacimonetes bacterium]|nr:thioredoxin family protein [Candidatus Cloacimonadota bacterium]